MVKGVTTRKRKNTEDAELKKSTKTETSNNSGERKLRKNVKESQEKQLNCKNISISENHRAYSKCSKILNTSCLLKWTRLTRQTSEGRAVAQW